MRLLSQKRCLDLGAAALRAHLAAEYSRYGSRIIVGGSCRGSDIEYFVGAHLGRELSEAEKRSPCTGDSSEPEPPLLAVCVINRLTGDYTIRSSYEGGPRLAVLGTPEARHD